MNRKNLVFIAAGAVLVLGLVLLSGMSDAWRSGAVGSSARPEWQAGTPAPSVRDIGVVGTGRVFVEPDVAFVTLGVEVTLPGLADATADVSKRSAAILERVKALGVPAKDITTVSYSIYPQMSQPRQGETARTVGYRVSNIVRLKVKKDEVGKVVDAAVNAGANNVGGISFAIEDSSKAEAEARELAVKSAMAKAEQLARAANVKLGEVVTITENVGARPSPLRYGVPAAAAAEAVGPGPVEAGQLEIAVSVEMHFDIAR